MRSAPKHPGMRHWPPVAGRLRHPCDVAAYITRQTSETRKKANGTTEVVVPLRTGRSRVAPARFGKAGRVPLAARHRLSALARSAPRRAGAQQQSARARATRRGRPNLVLDVVCFVDVLHRAQAWRARRPPHNLCGAICFSGFACGAVAPPQQHRACSRPGPAAHVVAGQGMATASAPGCLPSSAASQERMHRCTPWATLCFHEKLKLGPWAQTANAVRV